MSEDEETDEIINFLPIVTRFGRVTRPRIQTPSASALNANVNDNPGPSQQVTSGTCIVSQSSDVNNDSVKEVLTDQISSVSLAREESSVNQLSSVATAFPFVNQLDSVLKSFNMQNMTALTNAQFTQLLQAIGQNQNPNPNAQNSNKITTTLADSSLPRFAGRRRPHDRYFVQSQSFTQFLQEAESLMQTQNITGDAEKINFLAVLADKTVGDFNYQITFVRTNKAFQNSSYDEIIEYLKPMYAKVEEKTCLDAVQSLLRDGTVTVKDRNLIAQFLYPYHNSLEAVLDFFIESNPVEIITQAAGETNAAFAARMNDFIRNVIREFSLRIFWGAKLTGPVNNKAFQLNQGETRTYPESLKKLHDAIMQTSLNDKCLSNEVTRKDFVKNYDYPEYESYTVEEGCQPSDEYDSHDDTYDHETPFNEFEEHQSEALVANFHDQSRNARGQNSRARHYGRGRASPFRGSRRPYQNQYNQRSSRNSNEGFRSTHFGGLPQTHRDVPFDTGYLPDRPLSNEHTKPVARVNHKNAYHRSNADSFGNRDKSAKNKYCGACKKKGHWLSECPDYKLVKVTPDKGNEPKGRKDEEKLNKSQ